VVGESRLVQVDGVPLVLEDPAAVAGIVQDAAQ
jgi:hypothetical protein